jgi:glutathione S-transferase/RNA polymerase-associated protein
MALKLFEHPLSPYAQKVKIVLYEKGIPFERVFMDPTKPTNDRVYQEFVLASPRREVPALVDGEARIFDSSIVLEYIEERWPKPEMISERPAERARVRMLEEMMDTEYEAVNWGIGEVKVFERAKGDQARQLLTRASLQLQRLWNRLERELEGRQWMNGNTFGRGDAAVYPHVAGSQTFGFPVTDRHARLLDWGQRVATRSSIKRVTTEVADFLRQRKVEESDDEGGRRGVIRQYRDYRLEWMIKTGGADIVVEGMLHGSIRFADEFE